jgi:DNA-binding NtrC family response regulator
MRDRSSGSPAGEHIRIPQAHRGLNSVLPFPESGNVVNLRPPDGARVGRLIGRSAAMQRIFALIERIAPTDETVLIEGETGTGKELVAEAVHLESRRASGPFLIFDCSAVSAALVESELFGHVRGSFTGAGNDRAGALEAADGGTLFFDEIGELPLELQPKLLRAIESRQVRRVGANMGRQVDVRFVTATHRSLLHEVKCGRFREDLFHRLAVIPISLPPLRERADDIVLLARHFERQIRIQAGDPEMGLLSDAIVNALAARHWPGNVRELRNAVARLLVLGAEEIEGERATPPPAFDIVPVDLTEPLRVGRQRIADTYEKAYLEAALQRTDGNVSQAAELARVNRKFVQRAIKRHASR